MIDAILTDRVPLQMRIWYLVYETELSEAACNLQWLKSLAYRRGRMVRVMDGANLPTRYWTSAEGRARPSAADIIAGAAV